MNHEYHQLSENNFTAKGKTQVQRAAEFSGLGRGFMRQLSQHKNSQIKLCSGIHEV